MQLSLWVPLALAIIACAPGTAEAWHELGELSASTLPLDLLPGVRCFTGSLTVVPVAVPIVEPPMELAPPAMLALVDLATPPAERVSLAEETPSEGAVVAIVAGPTPREVEGPTAGAAPFATTAEVGSPALIPSAVAHGLAPATIVAPAVAGNHAVDRDPPNEEAGTTAALAFAR